MAGNKFVAIFLMCMVVAAAMNLMAEAGDPGKGGSDVYNKCFEECHKSCTGGETHCEMSCDDTCDAEELKAKLSDVGKLDVGNLGVGDGVGKILH